MFVEFPIPTISRKVPSDMRSHDPLRPFSDHGIQFWSETRQFSAAHAQLRDSPFPRA